MTTAVISIALYVATLLVAIARVTDQFSISTRIWMLKYHRRKKLEARKDVKHPIPFAIARYR